MAADLESLWPGVEAALPDNPGPLLIAAEWGDENNESDLAYLLKWCAGHGKRPHRRTDVVRWPWRWIRRQSSYRYGAISNRSSPAGLCGCVAAPVRGFEPRPVERRIQDQPLRVHLACRWPVASARRCRSVQDHSPGPTGDHPCRHRDLCRLRNRSRQWQGRMPRVPFDRGEGVSSWKCQACGLSWPESARRCSACGAARGLSFSASRESLLSALVPVLPFCEREAAGKIDVDSDGAVWLTAASRDAGGTSVLEGAEVVSAGVAAIPLHPLASVLRHARGEVVRLEAAHGKVTVLVELEGRLRTEGPARPDTNLARFEFPTVDPDTVPAPSEPDESASAELDSDLFRSLASRVAFAAARKDDPQVAFALTGVQVSIARGRLAMMATDTRKLASASVAASTTGKAISAIIPARHVKAWAECARRAERVTLSLSETLARLDCGELSAWASQITGKFPRPIAATDELPHTLSVLRGRLTAAVEVALAMAEPDDPRVILRTG